MSNTGNPNGRPKQEYSRRRFQEAVKCLKQVISNPKNTVAIRVRCCELLMLIFGLSAPETRRDRESVRDLVMQHSFEKQLHSELDRKREMEDQERLAREQEQEHELALVRAQAVFNEVLDGDAD